MLLLIESFKQLDIEKINAVYGVTEWADSYDLFLDFFLEEGAFCALWVIEGKYCAALRVQNYLDGVLLTGLETAPDERQKGYGFSLVRDVIDALRMRGIRKIYSHIDKKNIPSRNLHKKCGFTVLRDSARLLDGTITTKMDTFFRDI